MKKKKSKKGLIVLFIIIIIALVGSGYYYLTNNKETNNTIKEVEKEEPQLKIIDLNSNSRNIAVMYNNISTVWGYQSGLQDAYLVYEIIVEGGYTRLMAIFKDQDNLDRIGTVRSSRPYFLDYALENDAIYIHFGASNQALSDIETLGVDNINFMNYTQGYWRDTSLNLAIEHTAFTSSALINEGIEKYGYRTTTTSSPVLNYTVEEKDLSTMEGAIEANSVFIDYSYCRSTSYTYDSVNKVYLRSQGTANGTYEHVDGVTGEQYTVKNIITYKIANESIDSYGRQELSNIGSGEGYYITNGYAIPITWQKTSRSSKTIYKYLNGEEIEVNDGNTFIQIQPADEELVIK